MNSIRCAAALSLAFVLALPAWAARPALAPAPGEVIVQFKADAAALRKRVLAG
ncbi:MAG: hypothetical protein IH627_03880, partial [Rubrivivax sp.]|nr:hypothetical protein [Rubrivivax sp.]